MDDSILEHALNFGITSAVSKFSVTKEKVTEVVKTFMHDVSTSCQCDQARNKGMIWMCFQCTGRQVSHSLKSFNWNS